MDIRCPYCGSHDVDSDYQFPYEEDNFSLGEGVPVAFCNDCEQPIPDPSTK